MQKSLFFLFSVLLSLTLKAQLRNASFEQTDSLGNISDWVLTSGKTTQLSSAQFGVIPFPPFEGNYFVLLESDTLTSTIHKGLFEQTFPTNDTPGSFMFRYFYIPESISQQGNIDLLLTKWNGTSRDTVLYITKPIIAVADSNQIRIQWNQHATTLTGNYRNSTLPDSATIRFTNDNGTPTAKNLRLYVDALTFGKWAVGINEQVLQQLRIYPNPANNILWIEGASDETLSTLTAINGKQYPIGTTHTATGQMLDISSMQNGLYLLSIETAGKLQTKRILINHE